jgi:hypothetical protein
MRVNEIWRKIVRTKEAKWEEIAKHERSRESATLVGDNLADGHPSRVMLVQPCLVERDVDWFESSVLEEAVDKLRG